MGIHWHEDDSGVDGCCNCYGYIGPADPRYAQSWDHCNEMQECAVTPPVTDCDGTLTYSFSCGDHTYSEEVLTTRDDADSFNVCFASPPGTPFAACADTRPCVPAHSSPYVSTPDQSERLSSSAWLNGGSCPKACST